MYMLFGVFVFIFGTIIGSFLNVVAYRYNTGMGLGGRSKCFSCGMTLSWKELIPVLSFVAQGAKCKNCKTSISYQYPIVEACTGAIFWLVAQRSLPLIVPVGVPLLLAVFAIAALFIVISIYDVRHKIIPDGLVALLIAAGLLNALTTDDRWQTMGVGLLIAIFFASFWYFSKGRAMGLGDAKLALAIGWLLPPRESVTAVTLAVWIAAAIGVALLATHSKKTTLKTEIPFGPFLALGALIVYAFQFSLL